MKIRRHVASNDADVTIASRKNVTWMLSIALLVVSAIIISIIVETGILARAPVSGELECDGSVAGNVQFDGREVNLAGAAHWVDISSTQRVWRNVSWSYPLTDGVPAGLINVPDFTQFKLNGLTLHCKVKGTMPVGFVVLMQKEVTG